MSRTISVAASLAILICALWIVALAQVDSPSSISAMHATDTGPAVTTASPDPAATAVDDLAGWPIAAGR